MKEDLIIPSEQRQALGGIKLAIFDVDNTLVFAKNPEFYKQYGKKVEEAVSFYFEVNKEKAKEITDFYRQTYGGGEQSLFLGNAHIYFPEVGVKQPDVQVLYDFMSEIRPENDFYKQKKLRSAILELRSSGMKIAALTSSPDVLSRAILIDSGYDSEKDFDLFSAYERKTGPKKMINAEQVFKEIVDGFKVNPHEAIAIGDSLRYDVLPALKIGAIGCLISNENPADYSGIVLPKTLQLVFELNRAIIGAVSNQNS